MWGNNHLLEVSEHLFPTLTAFFAAYRDAARSQSATLNGWSLDGRDPRVIEKLFPLMGWLYHYYFKVQTDGWEHLPKDSKVLLIGSHNGGLAAPDLYMMYYDWCRHFSTDRPVYALMNPKIWQVLPGCAKLAAQMGAIRAHPSMAIAALQRNASLLIFPGGAQEVFRPHSQRKEVCFYHRKAFIKLALREEVPIIPLLSYGAHSTLIVLADLYPLLTELHQRGFPWFFGIDPEVCPIYLGLPWGLTIGPLPNIPLPMHIRTRVCLPIVFDFYGEAAAQDVDYVDECYRKVHVQMQAALHQLIQDYGV